ncbi:MAG TPA: hypothetical protein VE010_23595 [Thermoanaerobaculia bacterium]|nr:hypothetical protein [Thermoanaerobaculia bacterium]
MRIVRGNAAARFMPSRHNFAIFKLVAYLRLRGARPEAWDGIMVVDRQQSNVETWLVTIWLTVMGGCFTAAAFAIPLTFAIVLALLGIQAVAVASGVVIAPLWKAVVRSETSPMKVNAIVVMSLLTAAAMYTATRPTWARFAGWHFLSMLALNAVAAAIVFFLRNVIAQLESSVGGLSSAR